MQSFDEVEMRNVLEPMKMSTKLALLAGFLLFVVGLILLAAQGGFVDVEASVVNPPETPTASLAIDESRGRR